MYLQIYSSCCLSFLQQSSGGRWCPEVKLFRSRAVSYTDAYIIQLDNVILLLLCLFARPSIAASIVFVHINAVGHIIIVSSYYYYIIIYCNINMQFRASKTSIYICSMYNIRHLLFIFNFNSNIHFNYKTQNLRVITLNYSSFIMYVGTIIL